jgi:hypothetical protein
MPIPAAETESPGVGTAAKQIAEHASRLAKLRLELATLQLKSKAAAVGLGIGAALVALYALGFLFATVAVSLAIVLDAWLAMLLVTLGLFGLAAILGLVARAKLGAGATSEAKANGHN